MARTGWNEGRANPGATPMGRSGAQAQAWSRALDTPGSGLSGAVIRCEDRRLVLPPPARAGMEFRVYAIGERWLEMTTHPGVPGFPQRFRLSSRRRGRLARGYQEARFAAPPGCLLLVLEIVDGGSVWVLVADLGYARDALHGTRMEPRCLVVAPGGHVSPWGSGGPSVRSSNADGGGGVWQPTA
jgi:hypothetical protein